MAPRARVLALATLLCGCASLSGLTDGQDASTAPDASDVDGSPANDAAVDDAPVNAADAATDAPPPGTGTPVLSNVNANGGPINDLAVYGPLLYFTITGTPPKYLDGGVFRVPIAGGNPTVLAPNPMDPYALFVGAPGIVFNQYNDHLLLSTGLDGGATTSLATLPGQLSGLLVTGGNAYWMAWTQAMSCTACIGAAPLDGGPSQTLYGADSGGLGQQVAFAGAAFDPDGTAAYWAGGDSFTATEVRRLIFPSAVTALAIGQASPHALAVDGTKVFWATGGARILAVAKTGGGVIGMVANGVAGIVQMVVDFQNLYFLTADSIFRVSKSVPSTAPPVLVATGLQKPRLLRQDTTNLYWVDADLGGSVKRLVK